MTKCDYCGEEIGLLAVRYTWLDKKNDKAMHDRCLAEYQKNPEKIKPIEEKRQKEKELEEKKSDVQKRIFQQEEKTMKICPKCDDVIEEEKNFCSNCGYSFIQSKKKTGKPIAGGILIIIAACFCLVSGFWAIFKIYTAWETYTIFDYSSTLYYGLWWFMAVQLIFLIWAFSIGLPGGIYALSRKKFSVSIIGASFVIVGGCLDLFGTFFLGIVILILGILGTVFIGTSRNEFQVS
jgi:RNA polymerase subunit RPABC4/transcription elongation factor Spt4